MLPPQQDRTCNKCSAPLGLGTNRRNRAKTCAGCLKSSIQEKLLNTATAAGNRKKRECKPGVIGYHARRIIRLVRSSCENCGYKLFFEAAHIRPVRDFPPDALVSEINDPLNLVGLCPNCHWAFDHGFLTLKQIRESHFVLTMQSP